MTTSPNKMSDEELKKEVLTQICLIKYGNTPSNLSSEQIAQVAFASSDMYQLIKQHREAYGDEQVFAFAEMIENQMSMSSGKLVLPTAEDLIDNAKIDLTGKRQSRRIRKAFGIPEDVIGEQSHQYQEEIITSRASRKSRTR